MDIEMCLIIQFQYAKWPPFWNYSHHISFQTKCQIILKLWGSYWCNMEFHSCYNRFITIFKMVTVTARALDKLLGQLGIYATWLSSIACLQKQLRIFIFFYATFFFCDYMFSYFFLWSHRECACIFIYSHSLPS